MNFLLILWIMVGAWGNLAGWTLSLLARLDGVGYLYALLIGLALVYPLWTYGKSDKLRYGTRQSLRRRFRRPLPFVFLLAAIAAFVGGAIYVPSNYDALTYRIPRVLNWLAEKHWLWIRTANERLNYSATGFEWLMAPMLAWSKTDRFLFLPNWISFLFLPGLVYSVFRELGVKPKRAWFWMWVLPMGYCYILQAGSIGNDSYATVYLLASIHFSLLSQHSHRLFHIVAALISAALLTNAKSSNLPLLLPCAIAAWPALRLFRYRAAQILIAVLLAGIVSIAPHLTLNVRFTGSWTGDPKNSTRLQIASPPAGLIGNSLQLITQNIAPPVFPSAELWKKSWQKFMPEFSSCWFGSKYPRFSLDVNELQQEESAGIGLGVTSVACVSLYAFCRNFSRRKKNQQRQNFRRGWAVSCGAWIALAILGMKLGSEAFPRIVAPYYSLILLPIALLEGQTPTDRRVSAIRFALAFLSGLSGLMLLFVFPSRPLWPALKVLHILNERFQHVAIFSKMHNVYSRYSTRARAFSTLLEFVPGNVKTLGFVTTGDDPETSLWKPLGSRRIIHVLPNDSLDQIRKSGVEIVVLPDDHAGGLPFHEWIIKMNAQVLGTKRLALTSGRDGEIWHVVRLPQQQ